RRPSRFRSAFTSRPGVALISLITLYAHTREILMVAATRFAVAAVSRRNLVTAATRSARRLCLGVGFLSSAIFSLLSSNHPFPIHSAKGKQTNSDRVENVVREAGRLTARPYDNDMI